MIRTQAPGYILVAPPDAIDAHRYEALHREGLRQRGVDTPAAIETLQRALALWNGPAYAEFSDEEWARPEAVRLEELRLGTRESLIDAVLAAGR
ncbi:MAG: BTAD domain-containing putative transcriptional regulator, partial [Acidimicrobiia bacterium]